MFLNANTATRSFRELSYDVDTLLSRMGELRPVDGDFYYGGIVEISWADGSVDVVPTISVVLALVEYYDDINDEWTTMFDHLSVVGANLIPSTQDTGSPYYYDGLALFLKGGPLSAKIGLVQADNSEGSIQIFRSTIRQLMAKSVTLPATAEIRGLDTSIVYSTASKVQRANVTNSMNSRIVNVGTLDAHTALINPMFKYPTDERVDASSLAAMSGPLGATKPVGFRVLGPMRLSSTQDVTIQSQVSRNGTTVSVNVPVKIPGGYQYLRTIPTPVPQSIMAPLNVNSAANIVTIYPFVTILGYTQMTDVVIQLDIPKFTDDGRVVQVNNPTGSDIRVCNAWMFTSNGSVGIVQSLNFITLPAYTIVDFIVRFDNSGSGLRVYMLPTTGIV